MGGGGGGGYLESAPFLFIHMQMTTPLWFKATSVVWILDLARQAWIVNFVAQWLSKVRYPLAFLVHVRCDWFGGVAMAAAVSSFDLRVRRCLSA